MRESQSTFRCHDGRLRVVADFAFTYLVIGGCAEINGYASTR